MKITNPNKYFTKQRSKLSLQVNAKLTLNNKKKEFYNIKVLERNVFSRITYKVGLFYYHKILQSPGEGEVSSPRTTQVNKENKYTVALASKSPPKTQQTKI